jgi:hypothetical protein
MPTGTGAVDALHHLQPAIAELDPHPGRQRHGSGQRAAVDERPVARAGVLQGDDLLVEDDLRVNARDTRVIDPQLAGRSASDHQRPVQGYPLSAGQQEVEMQGIVTRCAA